MVRGNWCTSNLKRPALRMASSNRKLVQEAQASLCTDGRSSELERGAKCSRGYEGQQFSPTRRGQGAGTNTVQYLGIAADEPERIARHTKTGYMLPLVEIGWIESYCRELCEKNGLLSPIYTSATRGGAGSATTKVWISSDYCGETTRNTGH